MDISTFFSWFNNNFTERAEKVNVPIEFENDNDSVGWHNRIHKLNPGQSDFVDNDDSNDE